MPSKVSIGIKIGAKAAAKSKIMAQAEDRAKTEAKIRQAIKAMVEVVASASVAEVARIMDELVANGDIAMPELPEDEGPESPDEALADAIASDYDWSDEDAEIFEPEVPLPRHVFVIRVCQDEQGAIQCLPPYSDWAGVEGKTAIGKGFLKTHNNRLRTYRVLGEFLVQEHAKALRKGPSALALGLEQKAFAQQWLNSIGVDATQLSRFLKECDLVWDKDLGGKSMPIRSLFCAQ